MADVFDTAEEARIWLDRKGERLWQKPELPTTAVVWISRAHKRKSVPTRFGSDATEQGISADANRSAVGGKRCLETMTAEQRKERAKMAAAASAKVRTKKAAERQNALRWQQHES